MTAISRFGFVILTALVVSVSSAARADVIFDNFGPGFSFPVVGRILQGELVNNIGNVDQAASFMTGASEVFVTDVKLGIYVSSPANSPFDGRGPLDVIIAADAGGLPGAALHTTSLNVQNYLAQVVDAPTAGEVHLNANTQYWIIADAKGTFDGAWEFNPTNDFGPTAGRSNNGPWNLHNPNDERMVFQVSGRLGVPEATTVGLLASLLGVGGIGWRGKRRADQF
jgi:hypothetical protein